MNPFDPKSQQVGQFGQGEESPNNRNNIDMRKLNVSAILDRNMVDHVNRMDSQIKGFNHMM